MPRALKGRTQRVTAVDIKHGRIRVPTSGSTKDLLPPRPAEIVVVLKGRPLGAKRYDPRFGPDRERSGVISIGRATLARLVHENEVLPIVRSAAGTLYIGDRGSKLRIAEWVNDPRSNLSRECVNASQTLRDFLGGTEPVWRSPLREDDYAELAGGLWSRLELPGPTPVADGFWPRRQPSWDAVATAIGPGGLHGVLLVEAKSHTNEVFSKCSATDPTSRKTIKRALRKAQEYLGVDAKVDWTSPYYQAANRLTFLYYLRARRNVPTWLFSVYFIGDGFEVDGVAQPCPPDEEGWGSTLSTMHAALGLPECHPLSHFSHDLFLAVRE